MPPAMQRAMASKRIFATATFRMGSKAGMGVVAMMRGAQGHADVSRGVSRAIGYGASGRMRSIVSASAPASQAIEVESSGQEEPVFFAEGGGMPESDAETVFPGQLDTLNGFTEGESVSFWRNWQWDDPTGQSGIASLRDRMAAKLLSDPLQGGSYLGYHAVRTSFFLLNAYAGLFASDRAREGSSGRSQLPSGISTSVSKAFPQLGYNLGEVGAMYMQDYDNINRGLYKLPWDMSIRHKQSNPLFIASRVRAFINEAVSTLRRRTEEQAEDVWVKSNLYPKYYMNTWHYQSDGWMSTNSAKVYETSTETLFLGRQDAMQRQTLVPLSSFVREKQSEGKLTSELRLLEVGAGTGRAMTFMIDNYPDMKFVCSELSPYYLQEARNNVKYYSRFKRAATTPDVTFLQAAAEDLPCDDESMDVVVNIYMFHELELSVLKRVVAEMSRVVKPGGMVILTDSIQLGDRPKLNANLGNFKAFNEPNYVDYINLDIGKLFMDAGLVPDAKEVGSSTKTLSFRKPVGAV